MTKVKILIQHGKLNLRKAFYFPCDNIFFARKTNWKKIKINNFWRFITRNLIIITQWSLSITSCVKPSSIIRQNILQFTIKWSGVVYCFVDDWWNKLQLWAGDIRDKYEAFEWLRPNLPKGPLLLPSTPELFHNAFVLKVLIFRQQLTLIGLARLNQRLVRDLRLALGTNRSHPKRPSSNSLTLRNVLHNHNHNIMTWNLPTTTTTTITAINLVNT